MGFAILFNDGGMEDEEIHSAEYDADEVVGISVQSAGGEVARIQVDNASPGIRLEVIRRSSLDSTYLDMEEIRERRERGEKREEDNADRVAEGRAAMADDEEKPLTAPSGAETTAELEQAPETGTTQNYDDMSKAELQSLAESKGVTVKSDMTKADIISALNQGQQVYS